jgi:hypothetical protein
MKSLEELIKIQYMVRKSSTKSTASSFNVGGGNGTSRMGRTKKKFKPRGTE